MINADFTPELLLPLQNLQKIRDNFGEELKRASDGKETSLAFLKNPLTRRSFVQDGEQFQVLVIGGTNFIGQMVRKPRQGLAFLHAQTATLPVFLRKEDFLAFVTKHINKHVRVVAINFAFPLDPFLRVGLIDGNLIRGTKKHTFGGMIGLSVGKTIEEALDHKKLIAVANDTICLVLSGLGLGERENLCGAVVGTECNMAFFLNDYTIVNLESGNFSNFERSKRGKEIDKGSENPGRQLFEKEVAGDYLFHHYNIAIRDTALHVSQASSTAELSTIAQTGLPHSVIAKQLLEYSASLVACQIAGICQFKKLPRLTFVMEGSLFWKGWNYRKMVEDYVERLEVPKGAIRFVQIENGAILGAAALVTR